MQDIRDSNNRVWHYLGYSFLDNSVYRGQILIHADVDCFRRFVTSSLPLDRDRVFNEATTQAIWHPTPNNNIPGFPNPGLSLVDLDFYYSYTITLNDGQQFEINDSNAAQYWNNPEFNFLELHTRTPSYATITLTPYNYNLTPHALGVDLYVFYCYTNTIPVSNVRVLRIRMDQDPVPDFPMGPPLPNDDDQWRLVGDPVRATMVTVMTNEMKLFDGIDGFVESIPVGQIRDKFLAGFGIRAAEIYIGDIDSGGMQLKYKRDGNGRYYISIAIMGWLLEFNDHLIGEMIEVCYYWRTNTTLELLFRLAPAN